MFNTLTVYPKNRDLRFFDPFRDLDDFSRPFFSDVPTSLFRTDIRDNGDAFLLEADLPGFSKDDIHVDLDNEKLTISAERHRNTENTDEKTGYICRERSFGSWSRSFGTEGIDTAGIRASYQDGVLRLNLPKAKPAEPAVTHLEIE